MQTPIVNTNFWCGKKVLITGHTGFKGSWLTLWLSELGAKVTGVGLKPDTKPNLFQQLRLEEHLLAHHITDICDLNGLSSIVEATQPEVVLHLAAQPLVRRSYDDPLSTWRTNVQGSLHVLESLKFSKRPCSIVMVTTDKVYANQEWDHGYRENDRLGGHDPYSSSKAAAEIAIASWRASFCGSDLHQTRHLSIATARAGNVIGGGDWSDQRIMPDAMRALIEDKPIFVRNPHATRPWQHVLEPLSGYLRLAERLSSEQGHNNRFADAFNFGPNLASNRSVRELAEEILLNWDGSWQDHSEPNAPHEATRLHLQIDKAHHQLGWRPRWNFKTTVERTVGWYKSVQNGGIPLESCLNDISAYQNQSYTSSKSTK